MVAASLPSRPCTACANRTGLRLQFHLHSPVGCHDAFEGCVNIHRLHHLRNRLQDGRRAPLSHQPVTRGQRRRQRQQAAAQVGNQAATRKSADRVQVK